jgi:hypothetical protein
MISAPILPGRFAMKVAIAATLLLLPLGPGALGASPKAATVAPKSKASTNDEVGESTGTIPWDPRRETFLSYFRHTEGRTRGMQCTPATLGSDSTLSITIPGKHAGYMAIFTEKAIYYFIADERHGSEEHPSIYSADQFEKLHHVTLRVRDLRALRLDESSGNIYEKIFQSAGRYGIVVGPDLETEDPLIDGWCEVRFEPGPGKSSIPGK